MSCSAPTIPSSADSVSPSPSGAATTSAWPRSNSASQPLIGRDVDSLVADLGGVYRELQSDSQLRWLGPEKGVVHLALAAVMNAVWDLAARAAGKPLWRLLAT